jgi:signal transduction histidine kinase
MKQPSPRRTWLLRAPFVVAILVLAGAVFVVSTLREISSTRATLLALSTAHAERVRLVVGESEAHAVTAFEAWEKQAGERLLAVAALADRMVADGHRTQARMDSLATANDLVCLTVRAGDGHVLAAAQVSDDEHQEAACWDELATGGLTDLKPGESRAQHVSIGNGATYRLIGARRRPDGGLVCAGMDEKALAQVRRSIGPGRLLQALGRQEGTVFLALQNASGILAATPNVTELSSVGEDTLLARVLATGQSAQREITFDGRPTLETVSMLAVDARSVSLLRVGQDLTGVRKLQRDTARSLAVHSLLLLVALGAGAALLLASRRLDVANAAWEAARREVTALEAEQARRERSFALGELASGVAHEIRNPLNAIGMVAQRLGREFTPTADVPEYRQLTDTVRGEVGRINRIIEQFLRYARPAAPSPRTVDLAVLVHDIAALVRARFDVKQVTLVVSAPAHLEAVIDPDLISQALHNLLDNALDACPAGAMATIELRVEGDRVLLTVRDTGPGIVPADLPRLFNLYHTTKPDGTGVGLAIVDQVASLHGGRALAASEPGQGATFTLDLPLSGAARDAP